jgi:hypothetical protein
MKFCDAEACHDCALPEGTPACLRQKATFCIWLAARVSSPAIKSALERMSFNLMEDANALEQEHGLKEVG